MDLEKVAYRSLGQWAQASELRLLTPSPLTEEPGVAVEVSVADVATAPTCFPFVDASSKFEAN